MQKYLAKQILLDQKEEAALLFKEKVVKREQEDPIRKSLKNNLIKVIVGVRRCGKSFLAHQVLKDKNYGYINFDDERLIGVKTQDLNDLLEVLKEINPHFKFLLLDEIQNIEGWELFVNRLRRSGYNLIITGSNSKLLSKELATHLTGRHFLIELYPFSFREFLAYQDLRFQEKDFYLTEKRAQIKRALNEYLKTGGFPELFRIELKNQYLKELYNKIITRDIMTRYRIKNPKTLREIALYSISNFGSKITYHKLKNIFEIKSVHTVKNYVSYLEEAYLLFQLYPFSFKFKEIIRGARKIYGIDCGLINAVSSPFSYNLGRLLENLVFLELKRAGKDFYFYADSSGGEIDFVIRGERKIKQLIQVCFDIDDFETKKREIKMLIKGSEKLNCSDLLILTFGNEDVIRETGKTILVKPVYKWLLE